MPFRQDPKAIGRLTGHHAALGVPAAAIKALVDNTNPGPCHDGNGGLFTSQANVASSLAAVQIFGGHGYRSEYGLEQGVRNAVGGTIYSGTNEIQYSRIASMLGLGT